MLRELFDNDEWSMLKQQDEKLCEKVKNLPDEIPLCNISQTSQFDAKSEKH